MLKLYQELPRALANIRVALDYQPWSPKLQYRAGMTYKGTGQRALVLKHLSAALCWSEDSDLQDDTAVASEEVRSMSTGDGVERNPH